MNATMQICAKGTDDLPDVCKGDSGGSLVCKKSDSKWYIAGFVFRIAHLSFNIKAKF